MSGESEMNITTYSVYSQYAQEDILSYKARSAMLKRIILSRCETINTFVEIMGKKRETVEKWISGYTYQNYPNRDDFLAICFLFEIPVDNLMKFFPKYSYCEWQEKINTKSEETRLFQPLFYENDEDIKVFFAAEILNSIFGETDRYLIFSDLSKVIQIIGDETDLFYFFQRLYQSDPGEYCNIIQKEIRMKEKSEAFQWGIGEYDECRKKLNLVNSPLYLWDYYCRIKEEIPEKRVVEVKKYLKTKQNNRDSLLDKKKTGRCIKKVIRYQFDNESEFEDITGYDISTVKKWTLAQSVPTRWEWEDLRRIFRLPLCNLMRFTKEDMIDFAIEDVCVLIPFVNLRNFWHLSISASKASLFYYLRDEVIEQIKDTPAGRYALRRLKRRICPLVDDIDIEPFGCDEEVYQEWAAYNDAWKFRDIDIWLSSEETLKQLGFLV